MGSIFVFFLKMLELLIKGLFSSYKGNRRYPYSRNMSSTDRVMALEKRRQQNGYRHQWLYYRCKEEGLLDEYNRLFKPNADKIKKVDYSNDNRIKFSFGRYKGKPIYDVWAADKQYIKYIANQDWLDDYPDEQSVIEELVINYD